MIRVTIELEYPYEERNAAGEWLEDKAFTVKGFKESDVIYVVADERDNGVKRNFRIRVLHPEDHQSPTHQSPAGSPSNTLESR